jgi:hypothetical protein
MKIGIFNDRPSHFEAEQYVIDTRRKTDGYKNGDLIISGSPFGACTNFELELAIRTDGSIGFRHWRICSGEVNHYFHTHENASPQNGGLTPAFIATPEQIETVNGLFSGRIMWEGLKLAIGATIQKICPIDVEAEETKIGKKIYLASRETAPAKQSRNDAR